MFFTVASSELKDECNDVRQRDVCRPEIDGKTVYRSDENGTSKNVKTVTCRSGEKPSRILTHAFYSPACTNDFFKTSTHVITCKFYRVKTYLINSHFTFVTSVIQYFRWEPELTLPVRG